MPDSAGEGFPNVGTQKGHEHLHFGDGYIYQYLGGSNGYPTSWVRARGKNVFLQVYSNTNQIPANTNLTLATFENVTSLEDITFDGVGTFTIQTAGMYFLSTHTQVAKTGGAGIQRLSMSPFLNGVAIPGAAITNSVSASPNDLRVIRNLRAHTLNIGDVIQIQYEVEASGVGLGLYAVQFGQLLAPSVKFTMFWVPI